MSATTGLERNANGRKSERASMSYSAISSVYLCVQLVSRSVGSDVHVATGTLQCVH